jgi:hypothetical protein
MNIAYTCKICKKHGITHHADDCPPTWVKALAPMLTCDDCVDRRTEFLEAVSLIYNLCFKLVKLRNAHLNEPELREKARKIREALIAATKRYAEIMAKINHLSAPVWMEDFVDQLMGSPDKSGTILHTYIRLLKETTTAAT